MGRHNRSEEAFFDFIPNNKIFLFNTKGGGSRAPSEPPLDPPLNLHRFYWPLPTQTVPDARRQLNIYFRMHRNGKQNVSAILVNPKTSQMRSLST